MKLCALAIVTILLATGAAYCRERNLLPNPGFEKGLTGWQRQGTAEFAVDAKIKRSGRQSGRITVTPGAALDYQQFFFTAAVKPGQEYRASFWLRTDVTTGAYGAVEFTKDGKRIDIVHNLNPIIYGDWKKVIMRATAPAGADSMLLHLVIHAHGTAWFDDAELVLLEKPPLEVRLTLRPKEVISDRWQGFGAQGDLFIFNPANSISEPDKQLIKRRITAMRPRIVRMIFDLASWEPERGKRTPDSPVFKDLIETLKLYQGIGADIHFNEWGNSFPPWLRASGRRIPPEEGKAYTDSVVAAVKYLREQCGITRLKYVTVYNEPNYGGITWEDYAALCRCLRASIKEAGLSGQVSIVGPDETNDQEWLRKSVAELGDVIGYYDVHNYTSNTGEEFGEWIAPAVSRVNAGGRLPGNRLMVCEFGMAKDMSTFATPHNGEYEYGFFLADCAIEAANRGVSAMLMWCISDWDREARMKWGLWRWKDEGWTPRPGFYSWSLLTRYTDLGSTVHGMDSDVRDAAAVAFRAPNNGAWTLLTVNRREEARPVTLSGLPAGSVWESYIYWRGTVPTPDNEMIRPGAPVTAGKDGVLKTTMPARSFVIWRQATQNSRLRT